MSGDLPTGWANATLAQLTANPKHDIISGPFGSNLKAAEYVDAGVPIIRLQNVDRNKFLEKNMRFIKPQKARELSAHAFQTGDIVISKLGDPLGKACIVPESLPRGIVVADVVRVRIDEARFCKPYAVYAINSPAVISQINQEMKGSTRPRVNLNHLRDLVIPLAPLSEQKRIVAKVEKMLAKVDASRARLEKVSALLKRFRQSVLAAACAGRLTADWRKGKGKSGGWVPSSVGEVLESLKYGTATKCEYAKRGVPVLRIPNVVSGRIDHSDLKYAKLPAKELQQLRLVAGDVLFIRSNGSVSLVGRTAVVSKAEENYAYAGYLIRLRPDRKKVEPDFLNLVLSSYDIRLQIEVEARSTSGVNNINSEEVRELSFQLPALPEQAEIVRRVEELFALADRLEARVGKARGQVDKLTQAILAKAFRGELVPQDPKDEPAEKLLARIRAATGPVAVQGGKVASSVSVRRGRPRKVR